MMPYMSNNQQQLILSARCARYGCLPRWWLVCLRPHMQNCAHVAAFKRMPFTRLHRSDCLKMAKPGSSVHHGSSWFLGHGFATICPRYYSHCSLAFHGSAHHGSSWLPMAHGSSWLLMAFHGSWLILRSCTITAVALRP